MREKKGRPPKKHDYEREIAILKYLSEADRQCTYIVKFIKCFETDKFHCIVLEWLQGGPLLYHTDNEDEYKDGDEDEDEDEDDEEDEDENANEDENEYEEISSNSGKAETKVVVKNISSFGIDRSALKNNNNNNSCGDRTSRHRMYSERLVRIFAKQMISAVAHLHKFGIMHRDIKTDHFCLVKDYDLLNDSSIQENQVLIKLIDFGSAKFFHGEKRYHRFCGTPLFQAPEMINGNGYDYRIDLWALGVSIYCLLYGFPPFQAETEAQLWEVIQTGQFSFPSEDDNESDISICCKGEVEVEPSFVSTSRTPTELTKKQNKRPISKEAKDLVSQLIRLSESERLAAETALQHEWFSMSL